MPASDGSRTTRREVTRVVYIRPPAPAPWPLEERSDLRVAAIKPYQPHRAVGGRGRVEALATVGEQPTIGNGLIYKPADRLGLLGRLPACAHVVHRDVGLRVLQISQQRDEPREGRGRRRVLSH